MAEGDDEMAESAVSGDSDDVTADRNTSDAGADEDGSGAVAGDGTAEDTTAEDTTAEDPTAEDGSTAGAGGSEDTDEADGDTTAAETTDESDGDDPSVERERDDNAEEPDESASAEEDGGENLAGGGGDTEVTDTDGDGASGVPGRAETGPTPARERRDDDGDGTTAADGFEGAPDDQEMPLTEHIEEMFKRLVAVVVVMGGVSLLVFPVAPDLINWLWYSYLPGSPEACEGGTSGTAACPRVYHPLGLLLARIKVASLVGFVLALPVLVYQSYLFMRPGLYPNERRYYLAAVPTSLLLAFVGLAFSYFLVLPFIFTYFLFYSEDVAEIAFGLTETFDLILLMMGLFAAVFQIPLFIMLAIMMGVTTRDWLVEKRYYFWLGFAGFAFLFSPDPTGMAPFMVGITMVVLFELTLLLLRWTDR